MLKLVHLLIAAMNTFFSLGASNSSIVKPLCGASAVLAFGIAIFAAIKELKLKPVEEITKEETKL